MFGPIIFLLCFVLIAPQSRAFLLTIFSDTTDWITRTAPFSYFVLILLLIAGIASMLLMAKWPEVPEPENPLAKYKDQEVESEFE